MITKSGSAVWKGNLREGSGTVSSQSGVLADQEYSFATRFENEKGTDPEELLAAAHAACFSMAFSNVLSEYGLTADSIETSAAVNLDPASLSIVKVDLVMSATIDGATEEIFQEAATKAKEGCPVSKLFNAEITLDASLK